MPSDFGYYGKGDKSDKSRPNSARKWSISFYNNFIYLSILIIYNNTKHQMDKKQRR